ncbi:MAG: galactosyldiacylglycerol synthase [Chloroflexi bacterium]|nr:galactosyldiacylglycerol synthase [Chloroflexota bacterium]
MIYLYEKESNKLLGEISEAQLQFLVEQLEEEWMEDQDYAITPLLVEVFENEKADAKLISLLREALGGKGEVEVAWRRQEAN